MLTPQVAKANPLAGEYCPGHVTGKAAKRRITVSRKSSLYHTGTVVAR